MISNVLSKSVQNSAFLVAQCYSHTMGVANFFFFKKVLKCPKTEKKMKSFLDPRPRPPPGDGGGVKVLLKKFKCPKMEKKSKFFLTPQSPFPLGVGKELFPWLYEESTGD